MDLAFNPNQPRAADGRWSKVGLAKSLLSGDWQPRLDAAKGRDLDGLPQKQTATPGHGEYVFHSNGRLQGLAADYNREHGLDTHPTDYSPVDPAKAAKVAQAFEEMTHNPSDPEVAKAYAALKTEVLAQYEVLDKAGYRYEFYPEGADPYPNTPREAVFDLTQNRHMFVFPTLGKDGGFGDLPGDRQDHPLLEKVPGLKWGGQDVTYNDVFRAVHDSFAHSKEGLGFRARGEDNAYRQHYAMFSADAQKALASETRGQNTWLNFGPYGDKNRTANTADTVFADQKAGILPDWAIDPDYFKSGTMDFAFNPNQPRDAEGQWTKTQTRSWLKAHPPAAKNILDTWDQATPGERQTGKDWYSNAHKIAQAMAKKHGVSVREAAGVIAAYSPQTPWGQNLINANEVLRTKKGIGGPGAHLDIVPTPNDFQDQHKGVMASGVNARRAEALLAGADFEEVFGGKRNKNGTLPPHSLKIRAFGELIAAGGQTPDGDTRVVIDRHAAGVARGVRLTEDEYAVDGPSSSYAKFNVYAEAYREAAATLSKREGRKVTPEEVQATTWLTRQRLNAGSVRARNALGDKDNDNSLNYFASYDPNIADIVGHPMTGYAELATPAYLRDIDLTRYVRTPEGAEHFGQPIGSPITADGPDALSRVKPPRNSWPENVKRVKLNGTNYTLDEARRLVGVSYEFEQRDLEGGDGSDAFRQSVDMQDKAQIVAKVWNSSTGGDAPYDDQIAASLWQEYQSPDYYRSINEVLRTGKSNGDFSVTPGQMRLTVDTVFEKGGYTIDKPMTVYRAMKSDGTDWAAKFQPGTFFTDSGIVSTTAHSKFAEGWLVGKADGTSKRKTKPSDVVIEIRLPAGQRIVGGDPQFIETMLPPGTRLKVVSAETKQADAVNPLNHKRNSFPYTHVIAEVAPA